MLGMKEFPKTKYHDPEVIKNCEIRKNNKLCQICEKYPNACDSELKRYDYCPGFWMPLTCG